MDGAQKDLLKHCSGPFLRVLCADPDAQVLCLGGVKWPDMDVTFFLSWGWSERGGGVGCWARLRLRQRLKALWILACGMCT